MRSVLILVDFQDKKKIINEFVNKKSKTNLV